MKLLTYEEWVQSASLRDGISQQVESKLRLEMYTFARDLEIELKNMDHQNYQHYFQKALSIFHRFNHQVSFRNFDRYIYLVASLFLAAKDEDMFNWSLDRYIIAFLTYCASGKGRALPSIHLVPQSELPKIQGTLDGKFSVELVKMYAEKVCDAESYILKMLGYDLDIIVPQVYFGEARKRLKLAHGDETKFWETAQKYLTDLFVTTIALCFHPKVICMAAIYLAQLFIKVQVEDIDGKQWFQLFDKQSLQQDTNSNDITNEATRMEDIVLIQKHFDETIKFLKY